MSTRKEIFLMPIEDVFSVKGRGAIVIGTVQKGTVKKGEKIIISGKNKEAITTNVTAFEGFIRDPDSFMPSPGDACGIFLREVEVSQLEAGMIITNAPSEYEDE